MHYFSPIETLPSLKYLNCQQQIYFKQNIIQLIKKVIVKSNATVLLSGKLSVSTFSTDCLNL